MTDALRRSLDDYREKTRRTAPERMAPAILDRLGLADRYLVLDSEIGPVYVAWNPRGVSAVRQAADSEAFEQWFRKRFGRRALPSTEAPANLDLVRRALAGESVDVEVDLRDCTPFEAAVLRKTREIRRGHARPYAWIAREVARPRAVRAVGSALANNPVPLLIPCHRVVRSDYTTGEYVFGPHAKQRLLHDEGLDLPTIGDLARKGYRFVGQPRKKYFCLPTCGNIMSDPEIVHLHTAAEGLELGLVPCGLCKPMAA